MSIGQMQVHSEFDSGSSEVRVKWGWFVALGVAFLVLGILAFGNLFFATAVSVLYIGTLMLIGAIAQIIEAFQVRRWGGFFFWLLSGLLYGAAGVLAFYNPLLAAGVLTLVLAFSMILAGGLRVGAGLRTPSVSGRGWIVTSGVITALAGVVVALGWPANTLWLLGLFLAIDLTFQGVMLIGFGLTLKSIR